MSSSLVDTVRFCRRRSLSTKRYGDNSRNPNFVIAEGISKHLTLHSLLRSMCNVTPPAGWRCLSVGRTIGQANSNVISEAVFARRVHVVGDTHRAGNVTARGACVHLESANKQSVPDGLPRCSLLFDLILWRGSLCTNLEFLMKRLADLEESWREEPQHTQFPNFLGREKGCICTAHLRAL